MNKEILDICTIDCCELSWQSISSFRMFIQLILHRNRINKPDPTPLVCIVAYLKDRKRVSFLLFVGTFQSKLASTLDVIP